MVCCLDVWLSLQDLLLFWQLFAAAAAAAAVALVPSLAQISSLVLHNKQTADCRCKPRVGSSSIGSPIKSPFERIKQIRSNQIKSCQIRLDAMQLTEPQPQRASLRFVRPNGKLAICIHRLATCIWLAPKTRRICNQHPMKQQSHIQTHG